MATLPSPVKEHLGLVVGLGSAVFISLRVLVVAGFDRETAYAILATQGTATVVLGALLPFLTGIPAVTGLVFIAHWALSDSLRRRWKRLAAGLALVLFGGLFFTLTSALILAGYALISAIVLGCLTEYARHRRRSSATAGPGRAGSGHPRLPKLGPFLVINCGMVAAVLCFSSNPWLPLEHVRSGQDEYIGFVLQASDNELVVLEKSPRGVARIRGEDIIRTYCITHPGVRDRILLNRITQTETDPYELCEDL